MNFLSRMKLKSLLKKTRTLHEKRDRGDNVNTTTEIKAQRDLAKFYEKNRHDKSIQQVEDLITEAYRVAAILGDSEAQYLFAKRKIDRGLFWQQWANDVYGREIHQTYAKANFDEALNYLEEAKNLGNPLAMRLLGSAYINAWGVEADKDKGFKLVVDSINEEQAWDRATQIFEELDLNKPEFFSAMMKLKEK